MALRTNSLLFGRGLALRRSINAVVANPKKNGRLGTQNVENDAWPMVVFMRAMLEEYENTGNRELLAAIERHYAAVYPDKDNLPKLKLTGFDQRTVLHVENLCRLAGLTGKKEYITLAGRIYQKFCTDNPKDGKTAGIMSLGMVQHEHAVSYHEFLKLPALLYTATGDPAYLKAAQRGFEMLEQNHELADGLSSGHEGLAGKRSDNVHETCNAIDFIWTCGAMLEATGDAKWGDKIEKVLFNAGFGSLTKDFKAHQYYSSPNQVILTNTSSHWNRDSDWGRETSEGRMCYRPGHDTECCSGNIHRLVPVFIKRMWLVDPAGKGVTAALYAPCKASFQLADGLFTITENTKYPFDHRIEFLFAAGKPQNFTFRMRIPGWSHGFKICWNGSDQRLEKGKEGFVALHREFRDGDKVELSFETEPMVRKANGSMSIDYGPLVFSLPVKAEVRRITSLLKSSEQFPAYEMLPMSPWNYGLPEGLTAKNVEVIQRKAAGYPWNEEASSLMLRVKGLPVTNWAIGDHPYTPDIPETPETNGQEQTLELVPLGTTLLRVTEFPILRKTQ